MSMQPINELEVATFPQLLIRTQHGCGTCQKVARWASRSMSAKGNECTVTMGRVSRAKLCANQKGKTISADNNSIAVVNGIACSTSIRMALSLLSKLALVDCGNRIGFTGLGLPFLLWNVFFLRRMGQWVSFPYCRLDLRHRNALNIFPTHAWRSLFLYRAVC